MLDAIVEDEAPFAEKTAQHRGRGRSYVAYGVDAARGQLALRRPAHVEQVGGREGSNLVAVVLRREHGDGVGLFVVRAELGEDLVPGRADGDGDAQLELYAFVYLIFKRLKPTLAELLRPGNGAPDFVEAEGLNDVAVIGVDFACHAREAQIAVKVRRHDVQLRARKEPGQMICPGSKPSVRRMRRRAGCAFSMAHFGGRFS